MPVSRHAARQLPFLFRALSRHVSTASPVLCCGPANPVYSHQFSTRSCLRQLVSKLQGNPSLAHYNACKAAARQFATTGSRQYRASRQQAYQLSSRGFNFRQPFRQQLDGETVVYGLIGANLAVYALWQINPQFAAEHFMVSLQHLAAGRIHTLVTAAFSQRDTGHLFANMLALYYFGRGLGYYLGGMRLLQLYLVAGIAGDVAHCVYWHFRLGSKYALGASGAVDGIVILNCLMFPTATVYLYFVLPIQNWMLGVLKLYIDVSGAAQGTSNIGHAAHLAGAVVGAGYWLALRRGLLR